MLTSPMCLLFKANVEGDNCDRCKPDTFGLSVGNPLGCSKCYCYGLTQSCTEARGLIRMWVSRRIFIVLFLHCNGYFLTGGGLIIGNTFTFIHKYKTKMTKLVSVNVEQDGSV